MHGLLSYLFLEDMVCSVWIIIPANILSQYIIYFTFHDNSSGIRNRVINFFRSASPLNKIHKAFTYGHPTSTFLLIVNNFCKGINPFYKDFRTKFLKEKYATVHFTVHYSCDETIQRRYRLFLGKGVGGGCGKVFLCPHVRIQWRMC